MQYRFFYVKAYRFRADFPIIPVGAAICRPPKCVAFSYLHYNKMNPVNELYFVYSQGFVV